MCDAATHEEMVTYARESETMCHDLLVHVHDNYLKRAQRCEDALELLESGQLDAAADILEEVLS